MTLGRLTVVWSNSFQKFGQLVRTADPDIKFEGQGQRLTPVADAREITEIIMLLPSAAAAQFRKKSADVVVRFLGGCPTLVDEIAANRLTQDQIIAQ